ncbi:MAG: CARDB domain-containing protein, partial [Methanobacteriota archaeon]
VLATALVLSAPPASAAVAAGGSVPFSVTVRNTAARTRSIALAAVPDGGLSAEFADRTLRVGPRESLTVPGTLAATEIAAAGARLLRIEAASLGEDLPAARLSLPVAVRPDASATISLVSDAIPPGPSKLGLLVANDGNVPLRLELSAAMPPGFTASFPLGLAVAPGERRLVLGDIDVEPGLASGTYLVTVGASDGAFRTETPLSLRVLETPRVTITAGPATSGPADGATTHEIVVASIGNTRAVVDLVLSADPAVDAAIGASSFELSPGESATTRVTLAPAAGSAAGGPVSIRPYVRAPGESASRAGEAVEVFLSVLRSDLAVVATDASPRLRVERGDVVLVTATVENQGDAASDPTDAKLYVDDLLVAVAEVPAIPPRERREVSFGWTATGGRHALLTAVDVAGAVPELDETNNAREIPIEVGGGLGEIVGAEDVPAPGLVPVLLAIAIALAARRRRRPP